MHYLRLTALLAVFASLAACTGNSNIPDPDPQEPVYGGSEDPTWDEAETYGGDSAGGTDGSFVEDDSMGEELASVIYFEFDSSELSGEAEETVLRHAFLLADDSMLSVRLEGHADERGSREYNIGLGERRAQAVRRMLMLQGVSADQISTVSFGEERPQAYGSDEASYSQNRRVEFTYLNR